MSANEWSTLQSEVIKPHCDRVVRNPYDPEDRACEILTTIFLRSRGSSPEELDRSWLNCTIRGEAKKTFRKRKYEPSTLESEPPDDTQSVLDQICFMEQIDARRNLLPELTERQRQSLYTMFPIEGFQPTESEVGVLFGIKEPRVRQIRGEAVSLLRKKFLASGFIEAEGHGDESCR